MPPAARTVSPSTDTSQLREPRSKISARSLLVRLLCIAVIAFVAAEVICRFVVGLGDPPLYVAERNIEYLLQPSKTYYRFHNRFSVNRYGMRADDFPPAKSVASELRVIVIGDSIIYGGVQVDQNAIDTEILKRGLSQQTGRPVVVGNASAKSWGPPNELAYLRHFGTLQADIVVLELSSHDYADVPTFVPVVGVSAAYPNKKPPLALVDLLLTYLLPRYFHIGDTPAGIEKTASDVLPSSTDIAQCLDAEREFYRFVRAHHARVALVQHLSLPELNDKFQAGYYANQGVAKNEGVPFVDDATELRESLQRGVNPFNSGDALHLNRDGQVILAHVLQGAVNLALDSN
jgi:hypothetical protein